jgi:hypothetical protein
MNAHLPGRLSFTSPMPKPSWEAPFQKDMTQREARIGQIIWPICASGYILYTKERTFSDPGLKGKTQSDLHNRYSKITHQFILNIQSSRVLVPAGTSKSTSQHPGRNQRHGVRC